MLKVLHYELEIPLNSNTIANKTLLISLAAHVFTALIECNRCSRTHYHLSSELLENVKLISVTMQTLICILCY
ncbi:hypothetical protein T09_3003 [Trichinella sp. T9]|nr:hypothetical protein T09_3003 [Trichinella sp. T9]